MYQSQNSIHCPCSSKRSTKMLSHSALGTVVPSSVIIAAASVGDDRLPVDGNRLVVRFALSAAAPDPRATTRPPPRVRSAGRHTVCNSNARRRRIKRQSHWDRTIFHAATYRSSHSAADLRSIMMFPCVSAAKTEFPGSNSFGRSAAQLVVIGVKRRAHLDVNVQSPTSCPCCRSPRPAANGADLLPDLHRDRAQVRVDHEQVRACHAAVPASVRASTPGSRLLV